MGLVVLAAALAMSACGTSRAAAPPQVRRLLIVSMPGIAWSDVERGDLPNLAALAARSAIGDLSTRIGNKPASTTDAYLTMGAGNRALAPALEAGIALDPSETFAGVPAADLLRRRLGVVPAGVGYLPIGAAVARNTTTSYRAEPGLLGDALAAGDIHRSVIANGDAAEGFEAAGLSPDTVDDRSAVATLMGADGTVPGGTVSRSLLEPAPAAPYGVRLDAAAVVSSFERAWSAPGRSVVLVETSDLLRARGYAASTSGGQGSTLRRAAVQASDQLLGQVVAHADPEHDAVLVLSPVSTSAAQLSVALLRAPGLSGGLLRSSTTRRAGYVELADVTPTVLGLFGLHARGDIEGRPFQVSPAATAGRVARLVHQGEAARFRDGVLPTTVTLTIVLLVLLLAAGLLGRWLGTRFRGRLRPLLAPWALAMLGVVPATYIVGRIAAARSGTAPFLLAVAAGATVVGLLGWAVERRRRGLGAIVVVGAIVAMFAVDVAIGAPLQLNTVFGYSVSVAGRFTGLGNLAFALFGASVVVLAALVVDRYPGTGLRWAIGLLGLGILIEGLPMLGADVGGVLAMVPAFGLTALLLAGRRPRWTHLVGLATAAVVTVVAFAFIDKARPAGSQTHLARLAQRALDGQWRDFFDTLGRRLHASFGGADLAAWLVAAAVLAASGAYVALQGTGGWERVAQLRSVQQHQPLVAAYSGLIVLALLGLVTNNSSIVVPMTMFIIVTPVVVLRYLVPVEEDRPRKRRPRLLRRCRRRRGPAGHRPGGPRPPEPAAGEPPQPRAPDRRRDPPRGGRDRRRRRPHPAGHGRSGRHPDRPGPAPAPGCPRGLRLPRRGGRPAGRRRRPGPARPSGGRRARSGDDRLREAGWGGGRLADAGRGRRRRPRRPRPARCGAHRAGRQPRQPARPRPGAHHQVGTARLRATGHRGRHRRGRDRHGRGGRRGAGAAPRGPARALHARRHGGRPHGRRPRGRYGAAAASPGTRTTVAIVLLFLTLVSEVVSFRRDHRTRAAPACASTSSADAAWGPDDAAPRRGVRHRIGLAGLVGLLLLVVLGGPAWAAPAAAVAATRPGRLLVISVPGLTWQDVVDHDLPALEGFFAESALRRPGPPERARLVGFRRGLPHHLGRCALHHDQGRRRPGPQRRRRQRRLDGGPDLHTPDRTGARRALREPGLANPGAGQQGPALDAILGLLTTTLRRSGVSASVIGNGDGADSTQPTYGRQVGLALADETGAVPAGALGTDLLRPDPAAPYGVRLNRAAVLDRFRAAWSAAAPSATSTPSTKGGVVMVEASDLARVLSSPPTIAATRYTAMWSTALTATDRLVQGLLAGVDLTKDSVLVVAPYNHAGDRDLTAVALHRPTTAAGYLRSASTQRDGFLTLVDVAPTILDTFGINRPADMEGRPAEVAPRASSVATRADHLVTLNAASRFRERLLVPTTAVAVLGLVLVTALAVAALAGRWRGRWPAVLRFAALVDITLLPSSYLARGFPLERLGIAFYWAFLAGATLALAAVATAVAARTKRPHLDLVLVLAVVAGVLVGDVVSGSHLSLSAAFGYSPTGNSRLFGISNYSYGMLATAVCLLAGLVLAARPTDEVGSPRSACSWRRWSWRACRSGASTSAACWPSPRPSGCSSRSSTAGASGCGPSSYGSPYPRHGDRLRLPGPVRGPQTSGAASVGSTNGSETRG